jgi:DNA-binding MarR family transcriptional regulator
MDKHDVDKIRAFNRFYTKVIGLLDKFLLDSKFTLPEVRVMYEIYHAKKISAKTITELLDMDKSYLSRVLLSFEIKGLIEKTSDHADARVQLIALSATGAKEYEKLNKASDNQIADIMENLNDQEVNKLISHMEAIQNILSKISK